MGLRAGALLLTSSAALAACGGGGGGGTTAASTPATTPTVPATLPRTVETTTAPTTTTPPATTSSSTATTAAKKPSTSTSPESQPGGAGDESGIRVPATFTVTGGRLVPPSIAVPAFLRISFGVRNGDARAHRVAFRGHTLSVPAHGSASVLVTGPRKGHYPVTVDGHRRGVIITGVQAGP